MTADDIAEFNEEWMQPWAIEAALGTATSRLFNKDSSGTTEVGERMAAMVRMFEVTHDTRYLDHLFDLIEIVLRYRDDRLFGSGPKVTDEIRNKVGLAAWGGGLLDNYGLHSVNEWTSSLYAYPIAAFARILAEDPAARARYQCNIIVSHCTCPDCRGRTALQARSPSTLRRSHSLRQSGARNGRGFSAADSRATCWQFHRSDAGGS